MCFTTALITTMAGSMSPAKRGPDGGDEARVLRADFSDFLGALLRIAGRGRPQECSAAPLGSLPRQRRR